MTDLELLLAADGCRATYCGDAVSADPGKFDWSRLLQLAQRHRVEALVWAGLGELRQFVPTATARQFAARSQQTVEANLRATMECAELHDRFYRSGVDLLFLKGLTLAALSYPNPMLKMGWDIDLLVAPTQIDEVARLLGERGYRLDIPAGANRRKLQNWHQLRKESVWCRPDAGMTIDLHSGLADNPLLLSGVGMASPRQQVRVASGIELPTLANDELFAYLCVHGASSAWFRLKWICDLAAYLHRQNPQEVARLYERSQRLGPGRAADQALLLARRIFGTAVPGELEERIKSRRISRWLARIAEAQLANPDEPTERLLGTAMIHLSQPLLMSGAKFPLAEIARQTRDLMMKAA